MKTYNNHPHWYNQPLRLTKEQKRDPLPVLDDFFECYHLNDVREMLWEWVTEVISSQRSISNEALSRNNHLYFYEKIEGIIEVAFVMKKKIHQHRRRVEKRRLMKGISPEKDLPVKVQVNNINSVIDKPAIETAANEDIFNKPKRLIEYIDDDPLYVINEIFKSDRLAFFCNKLRVWFDVALSAECSVYDEAKQRSQVILFRDQLLMLVEALYIIRTQNTKSDVNNISNEEDETRLLNRYQIANPLQIINSFFEKISTVYITQELNDCLDAGICFSGPWPDNMCEVNVLTMYRNVLCLIKSAERLLVR